MLSIGPREIAAAVRVLARGDLARSTAHVSPRRRASSVSSATTMGTDARARRQQRNERTDLRARRGGHRTRRRGAGARLHLGLDGGGAACRRRRTGARRHRREPDDRPDRHQAQDHAGDTGDHAGAHAQPGLRHDGRHVDRRRARPRRHRGCLSGHRGALPGTACRHDRERRSVQLQPAQEHQVRRGWRGAHRTRLASTLVPACTTTSGATSAPTGSRAMSLSSSASTPGCRSCRRPSCARSCAGSTPSSSSASGAGRWSSTGCTRYGVSSSTSRRTTTRPTQWAFAISFDDPADAIAFGRTKGARRLIDTGRHVYTNWQPIISRHPQHPRLDPYKWAARDVKHDDGSCQRTLEILARTCTIELAPEIPGPVFNQLAKRFGR